MPDPRIPSELAASADGDPERAAWLAALPRQLKRARRHFGLSAIGTPFEPGGQTAWVASAVTAHGDDVVLKLGVRHFEAEDEATGLRRWDGEGAVRVLDAVMFDATTSAMVLERCHPGTNLGTRPGPEQDAVIADLLQLLWRASPSGVRPLSEMCDAWVAGFEARHPTGRVGRLDPGLVRAGLALFPALARDCPVEVLLHTDLHAENVLAAERAPWLAIDPKPYRGDPAYDLLQHLLNSLARLGTAPDALIARISDLAGLDAARVRLGLCARCVLGAERPDLAAIAAALPPR